MELLGVAYDGISAFKLVQEKHPDILLTDIRMPGATGLELIESAKKLNPNLKCIIISGYKDFEYAQQGLRFGVKDYLLKPINQDELLRSIAHIVEEARENRTNLDKQVEMESKIKDFSQETRRTLLKTVLGQKQGTDPEEIVRLTSDLFRREEGMFRGSARFILVRPDIGYVDYTRDSFDMLLDKTIEMLKTDFAEPGCELLVELSRGGIGVLICGGDTARAQLLKAANRIREKVLGLRDLFRGATVTTVICPASASAEDLVFNICHACQAMEDRILTEPNRIVELSKTSLEELRENLAVKSEIDRYLEDAEENIRLESLSSFLQEVKSKVLSMDHINGIAMRECAMHLLSYFLKRLGTMDGTLEKEEVTESFTVLYDHCGSTDDVFALLDQTVCDIRDAVFENLKNREIRPIKFAKQYIEENKGMNISLEDLADQVGFSYNYFSSLFKKETGKTVTEYIQQVRIEAAKKLLLEKEKKIPEIAALVGYNDVKFFTKQFKKAVGVSPGEFQKLFYEK
ncbi:MAG: helix-turn-helix domain-containing protein [Lachnospiraceae bacterium]|nr:helix-turn-helix domain-containing protein [Lachnospiraceae bacterium]